ncbi:SDR family oxidoreductase [Streptomyces sp. NPDC051907]|uniref:SDR family NAD(P)-dependent oxidoreductase n=1 Tax=Streptomyces sp. NPDC051907 TaxID=3155284 RepID=UPI003415BC7D
MTAAPTAETARTAQTARTAARTAAARARFASASVLVTGAGSGLGRAIALAFAAEGASVVVAGRRAGALDETVALIEKEGGTAFAHPADVTRSEDVRDLVRAAVDRFGGLDVAVNNAGVLRGTGPVGDVSEEDWDAVLRTNVTGVWLAMKHQIAHMKDHGGGAIVNVSSNLGAHLRIPDVGAYITSKAAVSALTRAAALDHIHQGVRVNAVSPGASEAPMSLRPGETEADRAERLTSENPLGRAAAAEEVAAAVLYLASADAGAVVGTDLVIDSGSSA